MATQSMDSESFKEELASSNTDAEVKDVKDILTPTGSGAQENVPTEIGNGTLPTSNVIGDLNPDVSDSDSIVDDNTSLQSSTGNSSRLRKFVTSAKERFDNLEPGWAQRKTSPSEEASGKQ